MQRTSEPGFSFDRDSKLTDFRPAKRPGQLGEYPYRRGLYLRVTNCRPWTVGQAGCSATEPRRRDSELIEAGHVLYLRRNAISPDVALGRAQGALREVTGGYQPGER
jgi:hypothetical protein